MERSEPETELAYRKRAARHLREAAIYKWVGLSVAASSLVCFGLTRQAEHNETPIRSMGVAEAQTQKDLPGLTPLETVEAFGFVIGAIAGLAGKFAEDDY